MAVLIAEDLELSWGDRHVLRGCGLRVEPRERVGLVGPNGSGKSSLLAVLAGRLSADAGEVRRQGRVAVLAQDPDLPGQTVDDVVRAALAWHGELKTAWESALAAGDLDAAAALQARLDAEGWVVDHKIDGLLDQTGAPPRDRALDGLSGGERRRLALAATLLQQPDVLLLDEPTNHLDAVTIDWLEKHLAGLPCAIVLVTHDRYLLEAVAERIVEIEEGVTVSYEGSYADYLLARAERHARLQRTEDRRLAMLARETAWAARSPAARSTKQRARLQRLDALRDQGQAVPVDRTFTLEFASGLKSSGTFLEAHGLELSLGGRRLLGGVDLTLRPGERLGIVGPNGIGKSTLLRVLAGELRPEAGSLTRAPRVKVGVLDQARTGLDPSHTVFEAAGGGNDQVKVGERWVHVAGFLANLLFGREQLDGRVSGLSGGERARLLLARRMLEGNAVLLLDEPTNDLDLWTLRVLEEALLAFDGAAVIVTHDRAFLDRVCTSVLAFEGEGRVVAYADRVQADRAQAERRSAAAAAPVASAPKPKAASARRISWKEQQELAGLPDAIEALEAEQAALETTLGDPATYRDRAGEVPELTARLDALPGQIEGLYARWEALAALPGA